MTRQEFEFLMIDLTGFFLEKDVHVYKTRRNRKRYWGINDFNSYTEEEFENLNDPDAPIPWHPLCEFRTLDELWEYEYKGKKFGDWIAGLTELVIDNQFDSDDDEEEILPEGTFRFNSEGL